MNALPFQIEGFAQISRSAKTLQAPAISQEAPFGLSEYFELDSSPDSILKL